MMHLKKHLTSLMNVYVLFVTLMTSNVVLAKNTATLVFASDMPIIDDQKNGDYPQLSTLINTYREQDENLFFVFGGASIGPSPMSTFDKGSHIIDILNSIEPDVMGVTKREFSYFEDELSLRSYEAAFPIVASNLFDPLTQGNLDGLVDDIIIEKNNLRLGFISVINQSVIKEYLLERVQVRDPNLAIELASTRLRERGADYVILMYSNVFPFIDRLLNRNTIDLAILSEPHFELAPNTTLPKHPNSVHITNVGEAAVINLTVKKDHSLQVEWQTKKLADFDKAPTISQQLAEYTVRLNRILDEEIGAIGTSFDTTRPTVRGEESAFGNLVADSMKLFVGAEAALINGGAIRGEKQYAADTPLTRKDIAIELPFRSRVVVLEITGQQLLLALENGFNQVSDLKGQFPQVSGMKISYNSNALPGSRVKSVLVNSEPINLRKVYKVATSDYLASGGDGYDAFLESRQLEIGSRVAPLLSDVVIDNIRKKGKVTPKKEGRLVNENG